MKSWRHYDAKIKLSFTNELLNCSKIKLGWGVKLLNKVEFFFVCAFVLLILKPVNGIYALDSCFIMCVYIQVCSCYKSSIKIIKQERWVESCACFYTSTFYRVKCPSN